MVSLQQAYVHRVEGKIGSLEVVENGTKVRVLGSGKNRPAIIPTTEELMAYVREPSTLRRIEVVQADALQRAEEKVAIAEQTCNLVENICKRLDADLEEMKGQLQTTGEFQKPGAAKPNDLAAIQVVPGSPDWILAKVITHDAQTGMYQLSDEDSESNKSKWTMGCTMVDRSQLFLVIPVLTVELRFKSLTCRRTKWLFWETFGVRVGGTRFLLFTRILQPFIKLRSSRQLVKLAVGGALSWSILLTTVTNMESLMTRPYCCNTSCDRPSNVLPRGLRECNHKRRTNTRATKYGHFERMP